jgi:hypothetical protein
MSFDQGGMSGRVDGEAKEVDEPMRRVGSPKLAAGEGLAVQLIGDAPDLPGLAQVEENPDIRLGRAADKLSQVSGGLRGNRHRLPDLRAQIDALRPG